MWGVADNLKRIEERVAAAAARTGREPGGVRIVAVSKTQPVEALREAIAAGMRELGENYVQEAAAKLPGLSRDGVRFHMIGHLQRNKAARAAALFDGVQTVDRPEIAAALGRHAAALGKTLEVLIEVNISGEESKSGAEPDRALELAAQVAAVPGLRLEGLMGIGPLGGEEGQVRESFRRLAGLFAELPPEHRRVLSMGMTGDFELAIEEGSTMVRIGTGIFGARRSR